MTRPQTAAKRLKRMPILPTDLTTAGKGKIQRKIQRSVVFFVVFVIQLQFERCILNTIVFQIQREYCNCISS